ncbi:hypothetical protein JOB18_021122 [Solea senegalensis]|uniref:Uncharacterized protein n=1 Tax=Solea senegalensis TaxID=28829 RepID=A0AAV6SA80_SOLSE|nr:hypothetical protein JOB18_021122 [Solea senegalensis]
MCMQGALWPHWSLSSRPFSCCRQGKKLTMTLRPSSTPALLCPASRWGFCAICPQEESVLETFNNCLICVQQILKILSLYTPHSDHDERVSLNFIRTVQGLLKSHSDGQPPLLHMDVRRVFPVSFPYSPPAALHADHLIIPDSLKISFLRRV